MQSCIAALLVLLPLAVGIPIDNGVQGDPEIECGSSSIAINFNTLNTFEGWLEAWHSRTSILNIQRKSHVYVKNRFAEPECRTSGGGRRVAGLQLPFSDCGVLRERSANPKGIFVSTTVVISFHPNFITKIDRAYTIQCFYMEADKTVSTDIEVSMITTGFQTQFVPMPICRYEILDGGPGGDVISFALIGQSVYHKWTCDTETVDTFCMLVHTCFVDDGAADRFDLIDTEGCSRDKNLIDNLEYPTDLMAGQESHVFKYADRAQLFFQCQITITVKEPNGDCPLPVCADAPQTQGRKKRAAVEDQVTVDVSSRQINVLDLTVHNDTTTTPVDSSAESHHIMLQSSSSDICVSDSGFLLLLVLMLAAVVCACASVLYGYAKSSKLDGSS